MYKFNLDRALKELGISMNKLSVESKVRSNTVIKYAKGETLRLDLYSMGCMLNTMNKIAMEKGIDKRYLMDDIIEYIPPQVIYERLDNLVNKDINKI